MLGNKKKQIINQYHIAGNCLPTTRVLIGYFEVTWHLTMKLFPAKISERAKLKNLWHQRVAVLPPGPIIKCLLFNYSIIFFCVWYLQITCYFPGSFRIGTLFLELFFKKRQTNNNRRSPATAFVYSCQRLVSKSAIMSSPKSWTIQQFSYVL